MYPMTCRSARLPAGAETSKVALGYPLLKKKLQNGVLIRGDIEIAIGLALTRLHQIAELVHGSTTIEPPVIFRSETNHCVPSVTVRKSGDLVCLPLVVVLDAR